MPPQILPTQLKNLRPCTCYYGGKGCPQRASAHKASLGLSGPAVDKLACSSRASPSAPPCCSHLLRTWRKPELLLRIYLLALEVAIVGTGRDKSISQGNCGMNIMRIHSPGISSVQHRSAGRYTAVLPSPRRAPLQDQSKTPGQL